MSLINQWNASKTSNREIAENLLVRYSTDQVVYDVAPKGDPSQAPSYVTDAEAAVLAATTDLETAASSLASARTQLTNAEIARSGAYSRWYANQNYSNWSAYMTTCNTFATVSSQVDSAEFTVERKRRILSEKQSELDAANERWATERQSVYYQGGRFVGFVYHRFATLRYRYVGFSSAAADACVAALQSLLTRTITKEAYFENGEVKTLTQTSNPSSVRAVRTAGDSYAVDVDVTEDDMKASPTLVSAASLFTTENQRVYFAELAGV